MKVLRALIVAGLLTLGLAACPPAPHPLPQAPLRLDVPLGPKEVRCGKVRSQSELIGGPGAYAEVGRSFRCYNNKIRFIVQDGSRPTGNSSRGGSLIDIDLVRDDELAPGFDSFRELAPTIGLNEVDIDSVEVIDDGRSGEQAIVRVSGRPAIASLAPAAAMLHYAFDGYIENDYILRPDSAVIEIRSTVTNDSDEVLGPLSVLDFWSPGRVTKPLTPKTGFGSASLFSSVPFLVAGRDTHTSYAYVCDGPRMTLPILESGITGPICTDDFYVGARDSYSRYVLVGDGSVESVAAPAWEMIGVATGSVEGQVQLADGSPAAGAWVSALDGPPGASDSKALSQARVDDQGYYHLTLPPGTVQVIAHQIDRQRSAPQQVEVAAQETRTADFVLGGQGRLHVQTRFLDRGGLPTASLPAKLSVVALGATQLPNPRIGEDVRNGLATYAVSVDGTFDVALPPGRYEVYVSRGFEFDRFVETVTVADGEQVNVEAEIQHVLDSGGLVGCEFHQHTLGSVDAEVPIALKVLENAAEGIEFAASTDHDNVVDFQPYVDDLGLAPYLSVVPGDEVTYQGIGHFNVYPWSIDPADPLADVGTRLWWGHTVPELFVELRQRAGDPIIQINHPRSVGSGYFAALGIDPLHGRLFAQDRTTMPTLPPTIYQDWSDNFDALEVNASLGSVEQFTPAGQQALFELARDRPGRVPVLADYFALLGAGARVAATGVSDSHKRNGGVGYPRTTLRVDTDNPAEVDGERMKAAMRGQRAAVGNGCLIELWVGERRPMGLGEAIDAKKLDRLRVRLQAPPFVDIQRLEIYVNGLAQTLRLVDGNLHIDSQGVLSLNIRDQASDPTLRLDATIRGLPHGDLAVVALARGGDGLWPTGDGSPFCFSAPLYVDEAGNGWRGWLADEQTLSRHSHVAP